MKRMVRFDAWLAAVVGLFALIDATAIADALDWTVTTVRLAGAIVLIVGVDVLTLPPLLRARRERRARESVAA